MVFILFPPKGEFYHFTNILATDVQTYNLSCIIGILEEAQISKSIIFFLKYPRKGKIKTRLAKAFGDTFVLELYECFIRDMLDKLEPIRERLKRGEWVIILILKDFLLKPFRFSRI